LTGQLKKKKGIHSKKKKRVKRIHLSYESRRKGKGQEKIREGQFGTQVKEKKRRGHQRRKEGRPYPGRIMVYIKGGGYTIEGSRKKNRRKGRNEDKKGVFRKRKRGGFVGERKKTPKAR